MCVYKYAILLLMVNTTTRLLPTNDQSNPKIRTYLNQINNLLRTTKVGTYIAQIGCAALALSLYRNCYGLYKLEQRKAQREKTEPKISKSFLDGQNQNKNSKIV